MHVLQNLTHTDVCPINLFSYFIYELVMFSLNVTITKTKTHIQNDKILNYKMQWITKK